MKYSTDLCFIDLETTGLDPNRHSIWDIGMIINGEEFQWFLDLEPSELETAESMALSIGDYHRRMHEARRRRSNARGIRPLGAGGSSATDDEENTVMREHEIVSAGDRHTLMHFIAYKTAGAHIVGAVPSFDVAFLGNLMRLHSVVPSWHYHLIDVENLAAGKLGVQPPWKLDDLLDELYINRHHDTFMKHTAIGDARMARAIYHEVFGFAAAYPQALNKKPPLLGMEERPEEVYPPGEEPHPTPIH